MVYLALTQQGLRELLDASEAAKTPVWCSADALSEAEFVKLERGNITRFTYSCANADMETIQDALATIEEHHPGGADLDRECRVRDLSNVLIVRWGSESDGPDRLLPARSRRS